MTTLSMNRVGQDLRCGLPASPVRAPLRSAVVSLFLVIFGAMLVEIPATVSTAQSSMPSVSVADLGVADALLTSAANSDDRAATRELLQCRLHAYRHRLDPATCEIAAP